MKRPQLAAAYVAIMFAGLLLFAAVAVLAIDSTLRSTLDQRLATEARATESFVDIAHGRISIDADDRRQFLSVLGVASDGVIIDPQGNVLLSSSARPPSAVRVRPDFTGYFDFGRGDSSARAYAAPLMHEGRRLGTAVIWRTTGLIDQTDRGAAVAFVVAAFVIALLALLAGNLVTRRALHDAFARQRRFTADASHELRAPLAVIRAEADLALRKPREVEAYRSAMQTIAAEADRMESLIGDLLSAARAENRRLTREHVDASAIVLAVSERLTSALTAKRSSLNVEVPPSAHVIADPHALERAVMAVAHNAAQHVGEGGHVGMRLQRMGAWVEVDVLDDGPGFSEAALAHAFERFWRGKPGSREHGGGLGLAIAKSIVEAFGGDISLSNRPNGGAMVRIRLRAAD